MGKFSLKLVILITISTLLPISQTYAKETSADFTCVAAPKIAPPPLPPELKILSKEVETRKPLCPPGQVPQPVFNKNNQHKGLPPIGALHNPKLDLSFHYVYSYRYADSIGSWSYFTQNKPHLDPNDYHSLAEIGVMSTDTKQIIEIGWTVDRGLNGDDQPHLFVFTWVNKVPNCYNGCGYVQYDRTVRPGMTVTSDGSQHIYLVQYFQGNWWYSYDGVWMGFFPESVWTSKGFTFNRSGLIEWFGEVAKNTGTTTQMGNGIFGSAAGSAQINQASVILASGASIPAGWALGATDLPCYNYASIPPGRDFRYGGPGC